MPTNGYNRTVSIDPCRLNGLKKAAREDTRSVRNKLDLILKNAGIKRLDDSGKEVPDQ
jgi:hypothetical protein